MGTAPCCLQAPGAIPSSVPEGTSPRVSALLPAPTTQCRGVACPVCRQAAYLVLLEVARVGEVDDGREVVHVGAAEAAPKEVVHQQGAEVGLAGARPAVQGQHQGLGGGGVPHEDLERLQHQRLGQVLAGQVLGQVTFQS